MEKCQEVKQRAKITSHLQRALLAAAVICHAQPAPAQAVVPPQTESFPLTYGGGNHETHEVSFGHAQAMNRHRRSSGRAFGPKTRVTMTEAKEEDNHEN
jgi:hypothetical protein